MAEAEEPRSVRWPRCLGVAELSTPGRYQALLELPASDETLTQIEKDLPRTMSHTGLMKPGTPMWDGVKRILRAYAAHDAATGYVQSMNFISAFLLLAGLSEEDAFWCLVALVSRVVPGYFSEGMAAAKLDARVFGALLHAHLPALALHLAELSAAAGDEHLVTSIIAGQWLLTLFVNVLPAACCVCVWDELAAAAHRAPLFAAALALLAGAEEEVCATVEMGEALELLQGLGSRALGEPAAADAFLARLRAYAAGPLSPAALVAACARELGERGPEAGLGSFLTGGRLAGAGAGAGAGPGAGPGYAAATDASELLRGLVSGGLYALAQGRPGGSGHGSSATPDGHDDPDGGLQAELAAVQCLEGGAPKATPSGGGVSGVGSSGALSAEDVLRVSDALLQLDRALRDAPWLRGAARDAVRGRVLRPLGALAGARLARARADLAAAADGFASAVDGVLAARGLSGLDRRQPTYLLMWEHGAGEAALASAEVLLERLARTRGGWRSLAHALATDDAGAGPGGLGTPSSSPVAFGGAGGAATPGGTEPGAAALDVCAATAEAACAQHAAKASAALAALRAQLDRRMAAAAEDLPRLAANEAEAAAYLRARGDAATNGAVHWMRIWDARRTAAAEAAADSLLASAAAAADALHGGPLPEAAVHDAGGGTTAAGDAPQPPPPAPPPAPREAPPEAATTLSGYETETARCGAALAALAVAQRNLTRRQERLGREAALVRAVRDRAACRAADAAARTEALRQAAARCDAHLRALAAPTAPAAADNVISRIAAVHSAAMAVVTSALADSARFLAEATTAVLMSYVTLIDRCVDDMGALSEQMAAALRAERDREAHKTSLGREVLSAVGTLSKAVNNVAAAGALAAAAAAGAAGSGAESGDEEPAAPGGARMTMPPRIATGATRAGAGASMLAGALRRGLRDVAAAARGYDSAPPEHDESPTHAAGAHPLDPSGVPASPPPPVRRAGDASLPPTPGGPIGWLLDGGAPTPGGSAAGGPGEDVVLDAEGRPRKKSKGEKALEQELKALADRRAELLERKEAITGLLRGVTSGAAPGKHARKPSRDDAAAPPGAAARGAPAPAGAEPGAQA